jgi:hypothetical protein
VLSVYSEKTPFEDRKTEEDFEVLQSRITMASGGPSGVCRADHVVLWEIINLAPDSIHFSRDITDIVCIHIVAGVFSLMLSSFIVLSFYFCVKEQKI